MRRIFLLAPVFVLSLASLAAAQAPEPVKGAPDDNSWKTPAAAVILAGFVIAVSIKKSKREHRD